MEVEFKSAIYKITNVANNKCYIGSAVDAYTRLAVHKSGLKYGKQPNKHLQASFIKYGINNFKFEILEYIADKNNLLFREQIWINYFQSYDPKFGYNKRKKPNSNLGIKRPHSEETKRKIGEANSISQLGKIMSQEQKDKIAKAHKGRHATEQARLNMKLAWEIRRTTYGDSGRA